MKPRNYLGRNLKKTRSGDPLPTKQRAELMSKIRSRDTRFEQEFIALLRKATRKKFQTNVVSIKGKPDIVFRGDKLCVFLDSNFWHGWQYPRWRHLLKNDFWRKKIERNRKRDRQVSLGLRNRGWNVIRIWEHEIKRGPERMLATIAFYLGTKHK